MSTFAIVSSYSESCGNAAFTKVLRDTIELYCKVRVEVIELDLKLLQSIDGRVRRQADAHVNEICQQLKKFDAVNIQMEAGLYGTLPHDIVRRTKQIIDANANTSVTLHSPRLIPATQSTARSGLKKIAQLKIISGIRELVDNRLAGIHIRINKKIIGHAVFRNRRLIVHTIRAREQIKSMYGYDKIDVHPLKFISEEFTPSPYVLECIRRELGLSDNDVLIGMFGYITDYKGHMDALRAMKHLPFNHKLLIFGRQHPQSLKSNGKIDYYLELLINTIESSKWLKKRVFFLGELPDEEFLQVASYIDVAWLPYYENGQDGSGIAAICMDACKRVLCSTSFAFDELFKLIPYRNMMRFDIGNNMEIATKTDMILRRDAQIMSNEDQLLFSTRTQAITYGKDLINSSTVNMSN
jgi:glycosyltransferase involved in cell wall biosynthesis